MKLLDYDETEQIIYAGCTITVVDAAEYLAEQGAPRPCESCGHTRWTLSISPGEGRYPVFPTVGSDPSSESKSAPLFLLQCGKCGLIRSYSLIALRTWVSQRKSATDE